MTDKEQLEYNIAAAKVLGINIAYTMKQSLLPLGTEQSDNYIKHRKNSELWVITHHINCKNEVTSRIGRLPEWEDGYVNFYEIFSIFNNAEDLVAVVKKLGEYGVHIGAMNHTGSAKWFVLGDNIADTVSFFVEYEQAVGEACKIKGVKNDRT